MNKNQIKLVITICTIFIVFFPIRSNAKIVVNKYGAYDTDVTFTTRSFNPGKQVEETNTYRGYKTWNGGGQSFSEMRGGWYQGYSPNSIPVTYEVTYCYDEAYKMIDLVNDFRKSEGKEPVVVNDVMMEIAMERAAQISLYMSHERPDSLDNVATGMFIVSENITESCESAEDAVEMLKNSRDGHRENMLSSSWKYAGFGMVKVKDQDTGEYTQYYTGAVQIYTSKKGGYAPKLENGDVVKGDYIDLAAMPLSNRQNYTEWYTADLNPEYITDFTSQYDSVEKCAGETSCNKEVIQNSKIGTVWTFKSPRVCTLWANPYIKKAFSQYLEMQSSQYTVTSSDPDVCKVIDQKTVQAVGSGTATITITWLQNPQYQSKVKMVVTGAKNSWTIDGITYQITDQKKHTAQVTEEVGNTDISIPATVKIKGKVYKVTKIASGAFQNDKDIYSVKLGNNVTVIGKNAFSGCTELKEVTLGSRVTRIEKNAFANCKKLKKLTIRSKKLKKVEKNAVKGVNKKIWIIAPKSKVKKYRKLFKKAGYKKIKRITNLM